MLSYLQSSQATALPLQDRQVVVIGGSSGIGLAVADLASRNGARPVIVGRNAERLQAAAEATNARTIVADLAVPQAVHAGFAGLDRIDHLVITAGTVRLDPLRDLTPEGIEAVIAERIAGPLLAIQAALPLLASDGSITLTSAQLAMRPLPVGALMAGAVAAVEAMTRALALELGPVRVNAVAPGFVDTPLLDPLLGAGKAAVIEKTTATLPVKRIGRAEEIAEAILLLMRNGFITGEVLHVDGGGRLV
ncbi:SDR family oxidoreductase [Labrys neptuniae]